MDITRTCKSLLVQDRRTRSLVDSYTQRRQHPWQKDRQGLQTAPKAGARPEAEKREQRSEEKKAEVVKREAEEEEEKEGTTSAPSAGARETKPPEPEGPPPSRKRSRSRHRGRRGGTRHQQHYRGLENPNLQFHRRLRARSSERQER